MKKFSKKGVLLFAAAMALCAFAMPSMASASSWGVVGSEHTLDSGNLGFINDASSVTSECSRAQFTLNVATATHLEITAASFTGCTAVGGVGTCTATSTATSLPWTATAVTTSSVTINRVNINVFFENHPGSAACGAVGVTLRVTGTLVGARWTGNGVGQHALDVNGGTGLVSHSALGNGQALTVTGQLADTQGTLTITN
jgi:hypothetical protein